MQLNKEYKHIRSYQLYNQVGYYSVSWRCLDEWRREFIFVQLWHKQVRKRHMEDTHCPRTLFILNMSILSALKMGRILSSQRISLLLDGFWRLLSLMYIQSCFTTWGLDNLSTSRRADSGPLSRNMKLNTTTPLTAEYAGI